MKSVIIFILAHLLSLSQANEQNTTELVENQDENDVKMAYRFVIPPEQPAEHPQMPVQNPTNNGQSLQRCRECLSTVENFQALNCKSVCNIKDLEKLIFAISQQQNPSGQFIQNQYVEQNTYKPAQPGQMFSGSLINPGFGTVNSGMNMNMQQSSMVIPPAQLPPQYYYPIAQLPNPSETHKTLVSVIVNGYLDVVNLFEKIKMEHFKLMCNSCLHLMLGVKAINDVTIQCPSSCPQEGFKTAESLKKFIVQGTNGGQGMH